MNETSCYLTLTELTQSVRLSSETIITIVDCGGSAGGSSAEGA